ncbi:MAG: copper ion binding protein, partial [Treponemataceae bacterium]
MVRTLKLQINGMTCAACARASERAAGKVAGVQEASVNFATELMRVSFDEGAASLDAIKAAIAKAGYQAVERVTEKEVTIPIGGMTCAACAKAVERAVGKLSGARAEVNIATEKALVRYDSETVRLSEIKAAITKAGYTPLAIADSSAKVDDHKAAKEREIRVLKTKLAVSAFFSAPLLYVAMGGMLGWPLPALVDAMNYPLNYALLELLLVIPTIVAGRRFYSVGFRAIARLSPNMDSLIAMGTSAAVAYSLYSTVSIASG